MPIISAQEPLYSLIKKHPSLSDVLYKLGFEDITKPKMLQTVGRFMTLKKGCKMRTIDIYDLQEKLQEYEFDLIDINA